MAKKIQAVVKLQIQAGGATPAPPVGTALGPTGVNIMDFCKAYNEATQDKKGQVIPVEISIFDDRTFEFKLKTPPAPKLILKAAGLDKGTDNPRTTKVGKITRAQVKEIAEIKMPDLNAIDIEGAMLQVEGTCRSMGVEVVEA
jgi:large subunit ribosomal protein L11